MSENPPGNGSHEEPPQNPEEGESRDVVPYQPPVPANTEAPKERLDEIRGNLDARDQIVDGEYTVVEEGPAGGEEATDSDTPESAEQPNHVVESSTSKRGGEEVSNHSSHESHGEHSGIFSRMIGVGRGVFGVLWHFFWQAWGRAKEMGGGGSSHGGQKEDKSHGGGHH
ncbi:MAG: hypothetical protein AAB472_00115 [Patescibacteria group bacterium]